jgi:outer membrane protein assembly factor BamA
MKKLLSIVLCLIGITFAQSGKDTVEYREHFIVVDTIIIRGNNITQPHIILNELTFQKGDTLTLSAINYNRERIYSLGIFNKVNVYPMPDIQKMVLYIDVEEAWYIWPIPFIELVDRDWKKLSYGIDLYIKNFRGENQNVHIKGAFGYDPHLNLSYSIPYLIRKDQIFLNWSAYYGNIKNRSQVADTLFGDNYNQRYIYSSLGIGKRFSLYARATLSGMFEYIKTPQSPYNANFPVKSVARIPSISAAYSYDSRDLAQFPSKGIYASTEYDYKGFGISNTRYSVFLLDYRQYKEIGNSISMKWRLATRQVFGNNIHYIDYSYLGYAERIRGNYSSQHEGNSMYVASVEAKYPIIKEWNLKLNLPVIPQALQSYRMALYYQVFFDAGMVRKQKQEISFNDFDSGYGGGITILFLPYNLIRLEMAWNKFGKLEYIVDIGVSF